MIDKNRNQQTISMFLETGLEKWLARICERSLQKKQREAIVLEDHEVQALGIKDEKTSLCHLNIDQNGYAVGSYPNTTTHAHIKAFIYYNAANREWLAFPYWKNLDSASE